MRYSGTVSRGVRAPIIREGDNLVQVVADSVMKCCQAEGLQLQDRDVVAVTEAVLARSQGNYATLEQIAADVRAKFPSGVVGVVFPILSRNRFSLLLKAIAMGADRVIVQLSYPSDEVGNQLVTFDMLDEAGVDPYKDVLTEADFRRLFGEVRHPFTGMDYVAFYKSLGDNIEVIFANDPRAILPYTKDVLTADIHTRRRSKRLLKAAGAQTVYGLDEILTAPVNGSGYNEQYGLLGSNKATDDKVKLFPRDAKQFAYALQKELISRSGKRVEAMVYGDGAFCDPVGHIWELADPVVSPGYTDGLEGTPNELKLKYLADTDFKDLQGEDARKAMVDAIKKKEQQGLPSQESAQGTTPRRLTDLLGSLSDLTSGSGDKGTPIILIQGYFDNYATEAE